MKWFFCKKCGKWHRTYPTTVIRCPFCGADITAQEVGEVGMKKDFIVRRSITMIEGKPHVETYSEQELVRCNDCESFWQEEVVDHFTGEKKIAICCGKGNRLKSRDWFCADGKRK